MQNQGDKTFEEVTESANVEDTYFENGFSVGWGTGFIDYNNDGWLDLYISNGYIPSDGSLFNEVNIPNALFMNNGDGTFLAKSGLNDDACGRGAAYADFNNDGRLDIIIVPVDRQGVGSDITTRKEVEIFYNISEEENNWVEFHLEGVLSNKSAIGTPIIFI